MTTLRPYVGVTGFTNINHVWPCLSEIPEDSSRIFAIGILASRKTILGQPNERTNRYPIISVFNDISVSNKQVMTIIHYNTDQPETLCSQLAKLKELSILLDGFQLNMAWPDPDSLWNVRNIFPEKKIILQIGTRAINLVNNQPMILAKKIRDEYFREGLIDYILLDLSGGRGIPLNPEVTATYLRAVKELNPELMPGVAGGLGPDTLHFIEPVLAEFQDLSFDGESKFRDSHDDMVVSVASAFVRRGFKLVDKFDRYNNPPKHANLIHSCSSVS